MSQATTQNNKQPSKMYREKDVNKDALKNKKVAILGYGSQGKAHALNLRDSGIDTQLGLRPQGKSWKIAEKDGWSPLPVQEAVQNADVVMFLVPDMIQASLYQEEVKGNLKKNALLMFAHGFAIHYDLITVSNDIDVAMVAPKSPGHLVREEYVKGAGTPCLIAVHQDVTGKGFDIALAYADAIGGARAGVFHTTFQAETESDLFGEQAVLCGGVTSLIAAGWETLVEDGYAPELAYFECLHELKLIVDLLYEGGFQRMHQFVSDTAKYGDLTRGPRVVNEDVKKQMKTVLREIQDGTFAREWVKEHESGGKRYKQLLTEDMAHPIEKIGKALRKNMAWLPKDES